MADMNMDDMPQAGQTNQIDANNLANPAQVQEFLGGMEYPANKQEVIDYVGRKGGDKSIMNTLEKLPDQEFETPAEVSQAIGDIEEM